MFEIKPIYTERDYEFALEEVEALFDSEPNSPEGNKLEVFVTLIEQYEDKYFPSLTPIQSKRFCTIWKAVA